MKVSNGVRNQYFTIKATYGKDTIESDVLKHGDAQFVAPSAKSAIQHAENLRALGVKRVKVLNPKGQVGDLIKAGFTFSNPSRERDVIAMSSSDIQKHASSKVPASSLQKASEWIRTSKPSLSDIYQHKDEHGNPVGQYMIDQAAQFLHIQKDYRKKTTTKRKK